MRKILVLVALICFSYIGTQAQTLDEVLGKYYKATNMEKLVKVNTFYEKMKMTMMGMEMPMEIQMKRPNKFRTETEVMGKKIISAFDGENGWMINPMAGGKVSELKGDELKQAMSQADMEGELYNYAQKGHTAELIGKVNTDGKAAYKIKLTDAGGTVKNYFIDASTYLILKMKTKVEAQGQTINVTTNFKEYKDIDGVKMPGKMEIETPMGNQVIEIEEIKFNVSIDNSVFARPAE